MEEKYRKWLNSISESQLAIEKSNIEDIISYSHNEKVIDIARVKLKIINSIKNDN